ncbi:MAG: nitroreductase family protein [Pseudomonadota bacterium]
MKPHDSVALTDFVSYASPEMIARAASFHESMKRRHTIRYFSREKVPQEVVESAVKTAGLAPSGANHQPWHFSVIASPQVKQTIRIKAEEEERAFYDGKAGQEWLDALDPLGTDENKEFLETAPYLIAVFAQRRGGVEVSDQKKNYYINESVGIACGFLIAALHQAGLGILTHTPNPMSFLNDVCKRPNNEKAYLLLVVGKPADNATVPTHATIKKPFQDIASFF